VSRPPLTWLYVPGDRPDRVAKALSSTADVVIVDLEDAIVADAKADARRATADALEDATDARPVQVRVNAAGTPWLADDLAMVAALPRAVGVRLPKAESVEAVRDVAAAAPNRPLHLLVESALGLERAYDLASSGVATVGLGEADLRAELGVSTDDGLLWARGRIVAAAAAAALPPPSMSVFTDVRDLEGLAASCRAGRSLGFLGRTAIHPTQLDVIRTAFTPTAEEVDRARELLSAVEAGAAAGRGAVALPDGRFVDEAVLRQARRVVALAP
jgi:citrate lyase subunit beta / citryl-CoA lyase